MAAAVAVPAAAVGVVVAALVTEGVAVGGGLWAVRLAVAGSE